MKNTMRGFLIAVFLVSGAAVADAGGPIVLAQGGHDHHAGMDHSVHEAPESEADDADAAMTTGAKGKTCGKSGMSGGHGGGKGGMGGMGGGHGGGKGGMSSGHGGGNGGMGGGHGGMGGHHQDVLSRLDRIEKRQILIETMLREMLLNDN